MCLLRLWLGCRCGGTSFAPHCLHFGAPSLIERYEAPFDTRGKISQHNLRRGMNTQRWSHEIQPWRLRRQPQAAEVSVSLKLAQAGVVVRILQVMPTHAHPVIKPLQGKVKIFVGFQLDDCQSSIVGDAKKIEHPTICRSKRGHLRVDVLRVESRIERFDVAPQHALEPALRLHTVEWVTLVASCDAPRKQSRHQISELILALLRQRSFICARAK